MNQKRLAISLGDVRGVGPEITLKALHQEMQKQDGWDYVVYGDRSLLDKLNRDLKIGCPSSLTVHSSFSRNSMEAPALAAVHWLRQAAAACMAGIANGMVTAPVSKEAIIQAGYESFTGQTEFLSELAGTNDTAMMLLGQSEYGNWLRIVLATTHVRISLLANSLTQEKVSKAIGRAADACKLLGLPQARIGVSGFNPHAGEGGKMGDEEQRIIIPAIEIAHQRGIDAVGPIPADALLRKAWMGEFDVVVSMYHDQALPALKMVAFNTGINWTVGLPFVRVSPDHGTAFDIAGKGIASEASMLAAIQLAKKLITHSSKP